MKSQFKKWKCRASSMGHICTKRDTITKDQLAEIKVLEDEKEIIANTDIIVQLALLEDNKSSLLKENQTFIGVLNP